MDDLAEIAWSSLIGIQGEPVEVLSSNGATFLVEAVFRNSTVDIDYDGRQVRSENPQISYRPGMSEIKVGDKVKVRNQWYRAFKKEIDGHGGYKFELQKIRG